ncbi:MAG: tetratricopeptide repeat protein [Bacteroidales bacterium]
MKKGILFYCIFHLFVGILHGISVDSLEQKVRVGNIREKKEALKTLVEYYQDKDSTKCFFYINALLELGNKNDDLEAQAHAYLLEGHFYKKRGNYNEAIQRIKKAIALLERNHRGILLGKAYNDMGAVLVDRGYYSEAAHYLTNAIRVFDEQKDSLQLSKSLLNLGLVFYYQKNYPFALQYYDRALSIRKALKDSSGMALLWNNIGIVYYYQGNKHKAIESFTHALDIYRKKELKRQMSLPLFNIGEIYFENRQYDSALHYYYQSYAIDTFLHDEAGSTKALIKIAATYAVKRNYEKARMLAHKALGLAKAIDSKEDIKDAYITLAEIYKDLKDYRLAYDYLDSASQAKDSLYDAAVAEQVAELQMKYESEKKDLLLQKQLETIRHQKIITRILAGATLIVVVFFIFGLIEYIQKRKAYQILEIQKKNITDSINYASKIQSALLPPEALMQTLLPESFVLYLPKEVVSGDFYWVFGTSDRVFIALADCTGHGVPGAFMSMLGFAYLNEIVSGNPTIGANDILEQLRKKVKESLHQHEKSESKDGMDIAMLIYFPADRKIEYAGANIPLMICRNSHLFYLPPDKTPIGFAFQEEHVFSAITIYLQAGDTLYLSSDGYCDQFGGDAMKKLGRARFEQIVTEASQLPIKAQKYFLTEKFLIWQDEMEQIDDISIMGIRLT